MINHVSSFASQIILSLTCIFSVLGCVDPNSNDIIKKIKTIELGMTKKDVIKILGEPRNTNEYELDGRYYVAMYYEPPSRLDSTTPSVIICKETEVVVKVIVDDSGKHDKKSESPNPCESYNLVR